MIDRLWYENRVAYRAIWHAANEGKRSPREGARLKKIGLKPGQPDYCLPIPKFPFGSLYIEMKKKNGRLTEAQVARIEELQAFGNAVCVCFGADEAFEIVQQYLGGTYVQQPTIS